MVVAHAQIGGLDEREFHRNNVVATERLLDAIAARGGCRLVHISSSVVNSAAVDWYTETKKAQERLVLASGNPCVVLRPTLMFGWFDRKHLGWLARFMQRAPGLPGAGRRPLPPPAALCRRFLRHHHGLPGAAARNGAQYNISGQERIDYIDLIRLVRDGVPARGRRSSGCPTGCSG